MSVENPRPLEMTSVLALRTWRLHGGATWVGSYLRLAEPRAEVVLPPDVLPLLHDLPTEINCASSDLSCGRETHEWRLRAQQALAALSHKTSADCTDKRPYLEWRGCIEDQRPVVATLPLGESAAPRRGWWILRDHPLGSPCATLRLYDLGSGAAYRVTNCYRS